MKIEMRKVRLFEENDYVRTPEGVGKVTSVTEVSRNNEFFENQDVFVQHKSGSSSNTSNEPIEIEGDSLHLITKNEYEGES